MSVPETWTCNCVNQCPQCGQCCQRACEHRRAWWTQNSASTGFQIQIPEARSEAERRAVDQRNMQIGLSVTILLVSTVSLLASLGVL